jgi:uncharacterized protein YndB with AHSA1/START domain
MSEQEPSYQLSVSRIFSAPRAAVYRAFMDTGQLCEWLAPAGWTIRPDQVEIDPRPGGRLSYTAASAHDPTLRTATSAVFGRVSEGRLFACRGEVRPKPAAIEMARALAIELHDEPGGMTRLELRAGPYTEAGEIDAREFWNLAFGRLDVLLEHTSSSV